MIAPSLPSPVTGSLVPASLADVVRAVAVRLREAGLDTPALDARLLVAHALEVARDAVFRQPKRPVSDAELIAVEAVVRRRLAHEPVSRIVGVRAFHGLDFAIGPATLDPRPDTETLVDGALALVVAGEIPGGDAPRILDLGTGSGAILIALLHALPKATGVGIDQSEEALAIATGNATRLGVTLRTAFHQSSWFDAVTGRFDLVVSNPPYIPSGEIASLDPDVAAYEPQAALDGGPDGLDAYRAIIPACHSVLGSGAWLILEVGRGQDQAVARMCRLAGLDVENAGLWGDPAGVIRCVAAKTRSPLMPK